MTGHSLVETRSPLYLKQSNIDLSDAGDLQENHASFSFPLWLENVVMCGIPSECKVILFPQKIKMLNKAKLGNDLLSFNSPSSSSYLKPERFSLWLSVASQFETHLTELI